jgi:hypothetical protein
MSADRGLARRRDRSEPFSGLDITGMPRREELGNHERRSFLSILPRRSLWPDVAELDARITELQRRHPEAQERARDLSAQRADAPQRDAQALSEWELSGRRGPKPEPATERLDAELTAAERDRDALAIACDRLLEEKAAFVEKHRDRLVRVAGQQVDAAHARARELIDELAQVRDSLAGLRSAQLWAALFPADVTSQQPQTSLIAYGLAAPVRDTLGLRPAPAFEAAKVLELLRRDVDELRTAATSGAESPPRGPRRALHPRPHLGQHRARPQRAARRARALLAGVCPGMGLRADRAAVRGIHSGPHRGGVTLRGDVHG